MPYKYRNCPKFQLHSMRPNAFTALSREMGVQLTPHECFGISIPSVRNIALLYLLKY